MVCESWTGRLALPGNLVDHHHMVLIPLVRRIVARTHIHRIPLPSHATHLETTTISIPRSAKKMSTFTWAPNTYPPSRASDHIDVYKSESKGEVNVKDPYNWLEINSDETDNWTTAQADYAKKFIDQYQYRSELENQIRSNLDYEKVSASQHICLDPNGSPIFISL